MLTAEGVAKNNVVFMAGCRIRVIVEEFNYDGIKRMMKIHDSFSPSESADLYDDFVDARNVLDSAKNVIFQKLIQINHIRDFQKVETLEEYQKNYGELMPWIDKAIKENKLPEISGKNGLLHQIHRDYQMSDKVLRKVIEHGIKLRKDVVGKRTGCHQSS